MYAKYGHPEDDYVAVMYEHCGERLERLGPCTISFHHGEMPSFDCKTFDTLAEAKSWAKTELGITHWRGSNGQFVARPD